MKLSYFDDMDPPTVELTDVGFVATKELEENTLADVDANGRVCVITFAPASERTALTQVTVEGLAA